MSTTRCRSGSAAQRWPSGSEPRPLVTENAKDLDLIARAWAVAGEHHAGIVFTSPRRYHRGSAAYPANLLGALSDLLAAPSPDRSDWVHWLP